MCIRDRNLTELKMERIKTLKTDNLTKIAVFFNVSVDYLLGNEEKPAGEVYKRQPPERSGTPSRCRFCSPDHPEG